MCVSREQSSQDMAVALDAAVRRLTKKGDRGERSLFNNCIS
jgi:hypothetical protein